MRQTPSRHFCHYFYRHIIAHFFPPYLSSDRASASRLDRATSNSNHGIRSSRRLPPQTASPSTCTLEIVIVLNQWFDSRGYHPSSLEKARHLSAPSPSSTPPIGRLNIEISIVGRGRAIVVAVTIIVHCRRTNTTSPPKIRVYFYSIHSHTLVQHTTAFTFISTAHIQQNGSLRIKRRSRQWVVRACH